MLLTIDIGNTNMNIGLFQDEMLTMSARLATERQKTDDQFAVEFLNIFKIYNIDFNKISGAVISSVVPEITIHVKNAVEKLIGTNVIVLSPGIKTGLNILIDNPAQLGADLAAGAVGAVSEYQLPALFLF